MSITELADSGILSHGRSYIGDEDSRHIMKILRDTLYSDKLRAVVREYIANALDATAEVDRTEPVVVILPTADDPFLRIRDYGPGMTREEVYDHFMVYGASSKRTGDGEPEPDTPAIGYLGIGCKSGFCYQPKFFISSFKDGTYNGYVMKVGDDDVSEAFEVSEDETKLPNGLLFSIEIKEDDQDKILGKIMDLFALCSDRIQVYLRSPDGTEQIAWGKGSSCELGVGNLFYIGPGLCLRKTDGSKSKVKISKSGVSYPLDYEPERNRTYRNFPTPDSMPSYYHWLVENFIWGYDAIAIVDGSDITVTANREWYENNVANNEQLRQLGIKAAYAVLENCISKCSVTEFPPAYVLERIVNCRNGIFPITVFYLIKNDRVGFWNFVHGLSNTPVPATLPRSNIMAVANILLKAVDPELFDLGIRFLRLETSEHVMPGAFYTKIVLAISMYVDEIAMGHRFIATKKGKKRKRATLQTSTAAGSPSYEILIPEGTPRSTDVVTLDCSDTVSYALLVGFHDFVLQYEHPEKKVKARKAFLEAVRIKEAQYKSAVETIAQTYQDNAGTIIRQAGVEIDPDSVTQAKMNLTSFIMDTTSSVFGYYYGAMAFMNRSPGRFSQFSIEITQNQVDAQLRTTGTTGGAQVARPVRRRPANRAETKLTGVRLLTDNFYTSQTDVLGFFGVTPMPNRRVYKLDDKTVGDLESAIIDNRLFRGNLDGDQVILHPESNFNVRIGSYCTEPFLKNIASSLPGAKSVLSAGILFSNVSSSRRALSGVTHAGEMMDQSCMEWFGHILPQGVSPFRYFVALCYYLTKTTAKITGIGRVERETSYIRMGGLTFDVPIVNRNRPCGSTATVVPTKLFVLPHRLYHILQYISSVSITEETDPDKIGWDELDELLDSETLLLSCLCSIVSQNNTYSGNCSTPTAEEVTFWDQLLRPSITRMFDFLFQRPFAISSSYGLLRHAHSNFRSNYFPFEFYNVIMHKLEKPERCIEPQAGDMSRHWEIKGRAFPSQDAFSKACNVIVPFDHTSGVVYGNYGQNYVNYRDGHVEGPEDIIPSLETYIESL